ncbi:Transposase [Pyrenophora tritici-repentis]|nr:Transposase [Pyrenophora tritici-repentis]
MPYALRHRLLEKPGTYQDKMAVFLYDEFDILVNNAAVSRALASMGWAKKVTRQIAMERNADLRDYYLHNLSAFQSHQLIYVDESGLHRAASSALWALAGAKVSAGHGQCLIHHSDGVQELCLRAGVKLVFLPPSSPDLDPIEEFFGDLRRFIG